MRLLSLQEPQPSTRRNEHKRALREEIEASIRIEPGVLTLYAVAVTDQPNQIRLFEVYAGAAAYQAHLQFEHFLKYKAQTVHMVKSLKLIETEPLLLGAKQERGGADYSSDEPLDYIYSPRTVALPFPMFASEERCHARSMVPSITYSRSRSAIIRREVYTCSGFHCSKQHPRLFVGQMPG